MHLGLHRQDLDRRRPMRLPGRSRCRDPKTRTFMLGGHNHTCSPHTGYLAFIFSTVCPGSECFP